MILYVRLRQAANILTHVHVRCYQEWHVATCQVKIFRSNSIEFILVMRRSTHYASLSWSRWSECFFSLERGTRTPGMAVRPQVHGMFVNYSFVCLLTIQSARTHSSAINWTNVNIKWFFIRVLLTFIFRKKTKPILNEIIVVHRHATRFFFFYQIHETKRVVLMYVQFYRR